MGGLNEAEQSIINAVRRAGTIPTAALDEAVQQFIKAREHDSKITLTSWLPDFLTRKVDSEIVYETLSGISIPATSFPSPTGETVVYADMPNAPGLEERLEMPAQYKFVKLLGKGGMGGVIRVTDTKFDRPAALKYPLDESALPHFEREARYHGQMRHKFIPPVYDKGVLPNGLPYFVMELIDGETLGAIDSGLRTRPKKYRAEYPLERILRLLVDICDGVNYLHTEHGIIHRDLKPDNVMVGKHSDLQIMDLGLAKRLKDPEIKTKNRIQPTGQGDRTSLTIQVTIRDDEIKGTLAYMPPEQAEGDLEFASDQYAIAAIAYEILTGIPFRNFPAHLTPINMVTQIATGKGFVGFQQPKKLAKPLQDIIMRGLNPDPTLRYPSVAEMRDDFLAYLTDVEVKKHKDVKAHKYSLWERGRILLREHAVPVVAGGLVAVAGVGLWALNENKNRSVEKQARTAAEERAKKEEQEKIAAQEREAKTKAELIAKQLKAERNIRQEASIELAKAVDFYKRGDLENAVLACEKALKTDDKYPDAYYEKGLIKYSNLHTKEAIDNFKKAIEASKKETGTLHIPATFYAGMVNIDLADQLQEGFNFMKQLVENVSDKNEPYVQLAQSFISYSNKDYEGTVKSAQELSKRFPAMWETWYWLALLHSEGIGSPVNIPALRTYRNYEQALEYIIRAIEKSPQQVKCLMHRARIYSATGNAEKAFEDADILVKMRPRIGVFYTLRGFTLTNLGKPEDSLQDLDKASELGDDSPEYYWVRSRAYRSLKRLDEAEQCLDNALKIEKRSAYYAYRALLRIDLRKLEDSLNDSEESIRLDPQNGMAWMAHGLYYALKDDKERAENDFKKAISLKFSSAYLNLGKLYMLMSEKEKALHAFKEYLQTNDTYQRSEVQKIVQKLESEHK